jgi:ABC-type branched-subunit amino acid transport system substrate-binding protein
LQGVLLALILALPAGVQLSSLRRTGQLTPSEKRGRQIYLQGTSPSGQPITAVMMNEGVETPGSVLFCAGCHGRDGRGKPEGGVTPSDITWDALTKPYTITHSSGRQHPPYNEQLLKRAITMGIDPAGHKLHAAMPRFRMSMQDMADLIAYLQQLGKSLDPGLTDITIRVGTIVPSSNRQAEMSRAIKSVLLAYFDQINQAGGIYNRRVDLHLIEPPDPPQARVKAIRAFIENEQIFALTSSAMAGADEQIASLIQEKEIPLVGAFTLYPPIDFPLNRYIFYLYSGLTDQGRALAAFAAKKSATKNPRTAIIYPDDKISREVAQAITKQCAASNWNAIEEVAIPRGQFSAAALTRNLSQKATEIVFFLGPNAAESLFLREAQNRHWNPMFLIPGSLAGREIFDAPVSFAGRVFLSLPTLPSDQTLDGLMEYRHLAETYKLPSQHLATQLMALSSAKILVEGLKRAGKDESREALIDALEKLYQFKTGFTPAITYGPNRRIGAMGAYIISIDPETKKLAPTSEWIEPN